MLAIAHWGQALALTKNLPGVGELRSELSKQILELGKPSPETFAELSGGALGVALGAIAAGRIPRDARRTADWRMVWTPDQHVDAEVTVARRKREHLARQEAANKLAAELFDSSRSFDVNVVLVDPTDAESSNAVRDAVCGLTADELREVAGKWRVAGVRSARAPTEVFVAGADEVPDWWPGDHARSFTFQQMVPTVDATAAPARIHITMGLPVRTYLNPVQRKADAPQGTKDLPFVVIADVAELPGALNEIPRRMDGFLPFWTAVSGVILFRGLMSFQGVGWHWRLVANPHARLALPESLIGKQIDPQRTMETIARFSS